MMDSKTAETAMATVASAGVLSFENKENGWKQGSRGGEHADNLGCPPTDSDGDYETRKNQDRRKRWLIRRSETEKQPSNLFPLCRSVLSFENKENRWKQGSRGGEHADDLGFPPTASDGDYETGKNQDLRKRWLIRWSETEKEE
ncbi:hypothetical protein PIB30_030221 [Stylosanthes scabra]|uniref:Uncharacterized protein n=1 Tax=Stylosanthes scabra TaxID=79078 RepID=A0ABU6VBB1_9FABA|nr:hypothetical protein [Stylosanthes scabra]